MKLKSFNCWTGRFTSLDSPEVTQGKFPVLMHEGPGNGRLELRLGYSWGSPETVGKAEYNLGRLVHAILKVSAPAFRYRGSVR